MTLELFNLFCVIFALDAYFEKSSILPSTYNDGYGIYDLDSGLMIEYKLPDVGEYVPPMPEKIVEEKTHFGMVVGTTPKNIYSETQIFYLVIDKKLSDSLYTTDNGYKLILTYSRRSDNYYLYNARGLVNNPYPFNSGKFLFSYLTEFTKTPPAPSPSIFSRKVVISPRPKPSNR